MNMEREIKILNIDDILPNRFQPRIQFSDKNINELADSIKEHGVIQPIVVRKISDKYEIIAGERRYKASILAGKTTIPAIITDLDDKNSAEIALIENVQRQDLTPIEEAVSYKKILDMGYITQTELAEKLGKTQSTIANKLRLLNLDDEVQEALLDGKISERHARSLLRLNNKSQIDMLSRIINERLTVRKTDEEVEKMLQTSPDVAGGTEKEREEIKMNEELKNEFNIPNSPIYQEEPFSVEPIKIEPTVEPVTQVEPVTPVTPVEPVVPVAPEIPVEAINPGFMDINKIENSAEDIFKEEKPADMDSLLKVEEPISKEVSAMAPIPEEVEEEPEEQPQRGKFFNMFNFKPREEENPNFVENIEAEETNMDFGIPKKDDNSFKPFNFNEEVETLDTTINPSQNINSVENTQINVNPFGTNIMNDIEPSDLEKLTEIKEVPTEPVMDKIEEPTIEPFSVEAPQEENINSNNDEEELFTSFNSYHLNEDSEFTTKIPVSEIKQEMETPTVISEPIISNIEEPIVEPFSVEAPQEVAPISEERYVAADFKTVINTIRDCASTIEKYGFKIEVEELDFENSYEVTFKIDK